MAPYLADTSAWNRSAFAQEWWEALLEANELATCAPVRLELLYSARSAHDYSELAYEYGRLPSLPLNKRVTAAAERTQAELASLGHHRGPSAVDLLVAAVAEVHGVTLLHHDRPFDAIARVTRQPAEWLPPRRVS